MGSLGDGVGNGVMIIVNGVVFGEFGMADPDEAQLSFLAKKMLAMPHKNRDELKVGRPTTGAKISPENDKTMSPTKRGDRRKR